MFDFRQERLDEIYSAKAEAHRLNLLQEERLNSIGRPGVVPPGASCYRRIGPFDQHSLPAGLLREHRLKEDVWGVVTMLSGSIQFIWDDAAGGAVELATPDSLVIPPDAPHHVAATGPFVLEIEFYR